MTGLLPTLSAVALSIADPSAVPRAEGREVGSICVLPFPKPADMQRRSAQGSPPAENYSIRLDSGRWIPLSARKAILLKDIPRGGRHKVAIQGDGRPFAAFAFTFAALGDAELCLWQSDLYQTWQLYASTESFAACRCKGIDAVAWARAPQGQ